MTILTELAQEASTYAITATFADENGDAVTPTAATWTLTDVNGTVINSRQDVPISSLGTSVTIVLSGNDLQVIDGVGLKRYLLIEGTYDGDLGSGLPLRSEVEFTIEDLKAFSGTV